MKFPFAVSSTIVLDQKEYGITSDRYILSKISDQMEHLGMAQQRISENEMTYTKVNPIRMFRRQDFLRNIRIQVNCTDDSIEIRLASNTILLFFGALSALLLPFFFGLYNSIPKSGMTNIILFHLLIFIMVAVFPYGMRAITLSLVKSELIVALSAFKIKN